MEATQNDLKHLEFLMARFSQCKTPPHEKTKQLVAEAVWSGDAWICSKKIKHYPALCRDGISIPVHSMVWVLGDGGREYVGYVEDLYENELGLKMVRLRRFMLTNEAKGLNIPKLNPECREVFFTSFQEDVSSNYIDGLAMVLIPSHFQKCDQLLPQSLSFKCLICSRKIELNNVSCFCLSELQGYSSQPIFLALKMHMPGQRPSICHNSIEEAEQRDSPMRVDQTTGTSDLVCGSPRRRLLTKVDRNIELLSNDSGMRGCWFRCRILQSSAKLLKVQYYDVEDAEGSGKLEECVLAGRVAAPDKMGVRRAGRLTVRPWSNWVDSSDARYEVGAAVDTWWSNGWWEGFVIGYDTLAQTNLQIYLPGENKFMTVERTKIRKSREWFEERWVDVMAKPDILSLITATLNPKPKVSLPTPVGSSPNSDPPKHEDHEGVSQQLPTPSLKSWDAKKIVEELHVIKRVKISETGCVKLLGKVTKMVM